MEKTRSCHLVVPYMARGAPQGQAFSIITGFLGDRAVQGPT
jgi:hypothetical protein